MKSADLPAVFAELRPAHVYRVGSEWRSPCPRCGGDDRLVMWERSQATGGPLAWCRQCSFTWSPDKSPEWVPLTREEIAAIAERRALAAEQERVRQEERRELFRQVPWWETFHHNLQHYPRAVQLWRDRYGIREWALHYYKLGYCPDFEYSHDGAEYVTDTLTIPIFKPATHYQIINLRHRLLDPNAAGGKYRPHTAGLGQPIFYANLNRRPESLPHVLIVEGEIKAAVIWQAVMEPMIAGQADPVTEWVAHNVQVIGVTGTSLNADNLASLEHAERIYVAFDPDACERQGRKPSKAEIFAGKFATSQRRRVLALPGKPDDLIVAGSMDVRDLVQYMKRGRAV